MLPLQFTSIAAAAFVCWVVFSQKNLRNIGKQSTLLSCVTISESTDWKTLQECAADFLGHIRLWKHSLKNTFPLQSQNRSFFLKVYELKPNNKTRGNISPKHGDFPQEEHGL